MAQDMKSTNRQTFKGSCHCGFIRYEIVYDMPSPPEQPTASRCNCTICQKSGFTSLRLSGKDDFKLLSPSSLEETSDYQWQSKDIHRYFCSKCGIQVYGCGKYVLPGGKDEHFFSVNALTLDQPQDGLDLTKWTIRYWDGKNNNWMSGPKDTPYLMGCV
jgi:hypothetical protein